MLFFSKLILEGRALKLSLLFVLTLAIFLGLSPSLAYSFVIVKKEPLPFCKGNLQKNNSCVEDDFEENSLEENPLEGLRGYVSAESQKE